MFDKFFNESEIGSGASQVTIAISLEGRINVNHHVLRNVLTLSILETGYILGKVAVTKQT